MAGDLARLTSASSGPEADMISNLLAQEGIRVLIQRPAGFDVPDFLAGGPRDILVPGAAAEAARGLLADTGEHPMDPNAPSDADERPVRLLLGILAALAVGALLVWLAYTALG